TCRLRKKKCDETHGSENDSCQTCVRLKIECLGWNPKRPEWMKDKKALEAYKTGLRGALLPVNLRKLSALQERPSPGASARTFQDAFLLDLAKTNSDHLASQQSFGIATAGDHGKSPLSESPRISSRLSPIDTFPNIFAYGSSQSSAPDPVKVPEFGSVDFVQSGAGLRETFHAAAWHSSLQEDHCIYYFEHVRPVQFIFAGNDVANVTCSLILQEPRGALTNAVCALASLHYKRTRVLRGLEAPDTDPGLSASKYFHDEAYFQLHCVKQARDAYSANDAVAALQLVWYSQLSGGATDWQRVFAVACEWVAQQTDLLNSDNPKLVLQGFSVEGQLIVKLTLWLDIFSSFTVMRPPIYMALYKRLVGPTNSQLKTSELRMESLIGCPEEVLLGIAEVSALAHWKAAEKDNGTLSNHELIRRGDEIEHRLRKSAELPVWGEADRTPLHPTLVQAGLDRVDALPFPRPEVRLLVAKIFLEAALLYLHTVVSDSNPGVPEISTSVGIVVQYLGQLPPSEVDRALVFPICLAGCMTDDLVRRDFFKGRLQALDGNLENSTRTRLLMEAVWQRRDESGATVDWRDTIQVQGLTLLLV
ncbi:fungal-specific transcription factor domain-containing protein, partial [Mycena belliarum]